jgi:hypothetical protein
MLGDDGRSRTRAPHRLEACRPCGALAPQLPGDHVFGPRQAETIHLADDGVAGDSDLMRDPAAGQTGLEAASERLDGLLTPSRIIAGHGGGLTVTNRLVAGDRHAGRNRPAHTLGLRRTQDTRHRTPLRRGGRADKKLSRFESPNKG